MSQPDDLSDFGLGLDLIVDPSPFFGAATPPDSPTLLPGQADHDMSDLINWPEQYNDAAVDEDSDPEVAALARANSATVDFLNMFPADTNPRAAQTVNLAVNMRTLFSLFFRSIALMLIRSWMQSTVFQWRCPRRRSM
jgi:hypothetical protein